MTFKCLKRNSKSSFLSSVSYTERVTHVASATRTRAGRRGGGAHGDLCGALRALCQGKRCTCWPSGSTVRTSPDKHVHVRAEPRSSSTPGQQDSGRQPCAASSGAAGRATPGTSLAGRERELSAAHQKSIPGPRPEERMHAGARREASHEQGGVVANGRGDGLSLARGACGSAAVGQEGSGGKPASEPRGRPRPTAAWRAAHSRRCAAGAGGGVSAERAAVGAEKHLDPRGV